MIASECVRYELCFRSLSNFGRSYVFACDALGKVVLDDLFGRVSSLTSAQHG